MNEEAKKYGFIISLMRMKKGWTLQELADMTGVAFQSINRLERGEHAPTIRTLNKLLKPFGKQLKVEDI